MYYWLIEHNVPEVLAGLILRHQMLASVRIQVGAATAYIPHRTIGSLTGSRTAGFAACIPVEHMVVKRHLHLEQWGFGTPYVVLSMATYVDNLFVAGKSSMAASQILDDFGSELLILRFRVTYPFVGSELLAGRSSFIEPVGWT